MDNHKTTECSNKATFWRAGQETFQIDLFSLFTAIFLIFTLISIMSFLKAMEDFLVF